MPADGERPMGRTCLRAVVQVCFVPFFFLLLNPGSAIGQGTNPFFTPPTFSGTGQAISADVNGDGKADLIFFDGTVLLGKGDGTFTAGAGWGVTNGGPNNPRRPFA